jgi:hypothetical protein
MNSYSEVLEWKFVNATHKSQRAVYHVGGYIYSLLCSDNGENTFADNNIFFHLPKTSQYLSDYRSMQNSLNINKSFRIFKKLERNKWIYIGHGLIFKIDSSHSNVHIFQITLLV